MPVESVTTANPNLPSIYQLRLEGHLGEQWSDWFGGLTLSSEENGDTLLTGPVADQAALHGLLRKVRDLGLPLVWAIRQVPPAATKPTSIQRREDE